MPIISRLVSVALGQEPAARVPPPLGKVGEDTVSGLELMAPADGPLLTQTPGRDAPGSPRWGAEHMRGVLVPADLGPHEGCREAGRGAVQPAEKLGGSGGAKRGQEEKAWQP